MFPKIHSLSQGGAHLRVEASITTPPLPLMLLTTHCSVPHTTAPQRSSLLHCNNNGISRILVKAQPSMGHGHLLGLAYDRKTWTYLMSTVLAPVAFLLLVHTSRHYALLTAYWIMFNTCSASRAWRRGEEKLAWTFW